MGQWLEQIRSPADLAPLSLAELDELAGEIREEIRESVTRHGGHLGSNLGVVELTLALHRVFNFAEDRLVWDVGHQCYTHKLLTGRRDGFQKLRERGGLSGFPSPAESPYDPFITGHAGTAISTALGLRAAADQLGHRRKVVAVIGDGSVGTGLAFEALNHAGHLKKDLLVILNDNEWSIHRTVGALSNYLSRARSTKLYRDFRREVRHLLRRARRVGRSLDALIEHVKNGIKATLVPGMLFEELGFRYFGPIDGHRIAVLLGALRDLKDVEGPVLLHVVTEKGRGHAPAIESPTRAHGVRPAPRLPDKIETDPSAAAETETYTDVFSRTVVQLAETEPTLVAVTAAMCEGTGLDPFREQFPDRYFDVGICEPHALGLAAGMAAAGLRPLVAIYSTFLQRAYDQVFHELCLQGGPVVLAVDRAGIVGGDGATHQGVFDIAYLAHLPGMVVMAPKDGRELESMLRFALTLDGPVAIRFPRAMTPPHLPSGPPIELGRLEIIQPGRDAVLVAYGAMVGSAWRAAQELRAAGLDVGLANARFVKPMDEDGLASLARTARVLVTVEDHALAGGFGSRVLEALNRKSLATPVVRLGVPDQFIEHGSRDQMLAELGLHPAGIAAAARQAVEQAPAWGDRSERETEGSRSEELL